MSDSNKNEELLKELKKLNKQFESKIKYDAQKEKTIERLHSELQKYKQDLYKKMLLPIVNDIIHFIEREERSISFMKKNPPSKEKLIERFSDLFDDMRDILYNQGIDAYKEDGDTFDPKRQKIIKRVVTNEILNDKKIANHKTWGYEWDGKIIKAEGIDLYSYEESEEDEKTIVASIVGKKRSNNLIELIEKEKKDIDLQVDKAFETITNGDPFNKKEDTIVEDTTVVVGKKDKIDFEENPENLTINTNISDNEILQAIEKNLQPENSDSYGLEMDFSGDDEIFKDRDEFDELEITSISSPKKGKSEFDDLEVTSVSSPKKRGFIEDETTLVESTAKRKRKKELEDTVISSPKRKV